MKAIGLVLLMLLLVFSSACRRHNPAPVRDANQSKVRSSMPLSKQNKYQPKYVVVKKGDTLYSIGFSQNIDYKTLARINGIGAPYSIYPGQKLRLKANKSSINNSVKTAPLITPKPYKATTNSKPASKSTQKVVVKNSSTKKPLAKKPIIKKPIYKKPPIQQAPSSNSRWLWPVKGKVISTFSQTDVARKGIDVSVKVGTSVYASNNGTVVYSGDGLRGYGELIIVKHSNNLLSAYAHNTSRLVKEGANVKQGQVIAKSGKGTDGKPLLHFEIRKNGQPVNPLKYLPK